MIKNFDKSVLEIGYRHSKNFCIVIPPPNITGSLHMGHAFQCTLMDILIRYYRMNGYSVLWKMGVDHAGIATQILIEQKYSFKEKDILIKKSFDWKKKAFKIIKKQLLKLNCSLDFNSSRFTLDNHFSYSVKKAFIQLYNENLIYKAKKLVNWDCGLQSAISDLEISYSEEESKLYYIKYKIIDSNNSYLIVSTSRPETIFADVAVALNTQDRRFNFLKNKKVEVPLTKKIIPIIFDENVDLNFGSGCLKITPGHDFNDFKIGLKHKLPIITAFDKNGCLNKNVPNKYLGMTLQDARICVVKDLYFYDLIEKIDSYKTKIPRGDRTDNIIEPYLTDQWFINTRPLIKPVINLIKNNKLKILPSRWKKDFLDWSEGINDWCISRQIWWGHRMPVWYDSFLNVYVGENEKIVRKKYVLDDNVVLKQETDVLDTWFSSALWPFASLGWPNITKEMTFYPTDILVTGFDIIFFWAIRMMMFGLKFTGMLPFKEIYIHGLIRDNFGNKMSKTKGNVIDPIDIIDGIDYKNLLKKRLRNLVNQKQVETIISNTKKYFSNGIKCFGVDVLRLMFMSISTDNMFLKLDFEKLENFKKFCNKLINASKFIKDRNVKRFLYSHKFKNNIYNEWLLSIWQKVKKTVNYNIQKRNFNLAISNIYKFFWHDFCDWYIEFSKISLVQKKYHSSSLYFLNSVFLEILLILYPLIPNLSKKLFAEHINSKVEISTLNYPKFQHNLVITTKEDYINLFKHICLKIRSFRSYFKQSIIMVFYFKFSFIKDLRKIEKIKSMLKIFLDIKKIYLIFDENKITFGTKVYFNEFYLLLPYYKTVEEINHLNKKLNKLNLDILVLKDKLSNVSFLKNANLTIINETKNKFKKLSIEYLNLKNFLL